MFDLPSTILAKAFICIQHVCNRTFIAYGFELVMLWSKDNKAFFTIGQRNQYTSLDLAKLNVLYKCGPGYYTAGYSND